MGNWYFVVGLICAGATGYILSKVLSEKEQQFAVVAAWGMIILWMPLLLLCLVGLVVLFGVLLGKILLKGSEGMYPKLVAVWKAFD